MPYANIGDIKLYYEIYGHELELGDDFAKKRPTLISLHGGPGIDHACYEVQYLKACSEFAQVIFIDHRGNGRSADPNPEHWNLIQWAKDVAAFVETLGLEKPFVSGCSFGGWVAQKYASLFPKQPAGVILIDTEGYVNHETVFKKFEERWGKAAREIVERYIKPNPPAEIAEGFRKCLYAASKNPIPEQWIKRSILNPDLANYNKEHTTFSFNLMKDLAKVTAPILYLASTINPFHNLETAEETRDALINAEVTFIPVEDCGLVGMDAREAAFIEIKKFMTSHFEEGR